MPLPDFSIILVNPQMGENIGAVARSMKNFNITDLRIISPRDGWPNEKSKRTCAGAIDVIDNAKIYNSIQEAIFDIEYVYASTSILRNMNKNYILSRDIFHDLTKNLSIVNSVGIMFGRENHGLNNKEISLANKILTIDTDINFNSLNIAHAVAIICYELFQHRDKYRFDLKNTQDLAVRSEMEQFYKHLFTELHNRQFFHTKKKEELMNIKIRNLFGRVDNLSKSELKILHGIISSLSASKKLPS